MELGARSLHGWLFLLQLTHKHTHPHTCFVSLWHGWEWLVLNWETVSCGAWSMLRHHHKVVHLWRWRVTYRNIIQKVSNKSCTKLQKSISWCFFNFVCFFQRQWSRIIKFIYVQHTDTDTESHINIYTDTVRHIQPASTSRWPLPARLATHCVWMLPRTTWLKMKGIRELASMLLPQHHIHHYPPDYIVLFAKHGCQATLVEKEKAVLEEQSLAKGHEPARLPILCPLHWRKGFIHDFRMYIERSNPIWPQDVRFPWLQEEMNVFNCLPK